MAKQYKTLHPQKYYRDYLAHEIRPDGRELYSFRPAVINSNAFATANGSAIAKIGKTTVVCGIKGELCRPKAGKPDEGYIIPNVELPPLCSPKFKPGPPSIDAQIATQLLADVIENSKCVSLKNLCIVKEKLVWCLYVDLICLDHDGALTDACVLSFMAALKTVRLPKVQYDVAIDKIEVFEEEKRKIQIQSIPLSTTFIIFEQFIMCDPTHEEEDLCTGTLTVVMNGNELCLVHKPGGAVLSEAQILDCIEKAKERYNNLMKVLDAVS